MLHLSTIDTSTLELLRSIMHCDEFTNLRLVGGTALALQLGHRKSIDLDFLLQKYSLSEILKLYRKKYFDGSEYLVLKSLTYFDDAEQDTDIKMLKDIPWATIKNHILNSVNLYNQSIK